MNVYEFVLTNDYTVFSVVLFLKSRFLLDRILVHQGMSNFSIAWRTEVLRLYTLSHESYYHSHLCLNITLVWNAWRLFKCTMKFRSKFFYLVCECETASSQSCVDVDTNIGYWYNSFWHEWALKINFIDTAAFVTVNLISFASFTDATGIP